MDIKSTKLRFGIIGNDLKLSRAINVALQVASTDISVLINGESGTGKETIPQIIHQNSKRKHNNYIAVNCGAIPEGTIVFVKEIGGDKYFQMQNVIQVIACS